MMRVDLYINGRNAREEWGVYTTVNTLGTLIAPPPMKEYPTFTSRLEHGTRTDTSNPRVASRDISLEIQMTAPDPNEFYRRHEALVAELQKGEFYLAVSDNPHVTYRLIYLSCSSYTQFRRGIATLSLKVTEPNPADRATPEGMEISSHILEEETGAYLMTENGEHIRFE